MDHVEGGTFTKLTLYFDQVDMRRAASHYPVRVHLRGLSSFVPMVAASLFAAWSIHQPALAQVPVQLPPAATSVVGARIHFDLGVFNEDGLYGPPDGLRAAAYEFCIPARHDLAAEVVSIDPTIQIYVNSPGRVGCGSDEYLCIGSTGQPGFRQVLVNLATLDYVTRIELSVAE